MISAINLSPVPLTPLKMITGDNDTDDKFSAGISDTGEQLLQVTTTPAITFFPGVIDTGHKLPKSLKFIAGVNDTVEELFTGVNDTAEELFTGVNDTADKFFGGVTTPAIRQSCLY